MIAEAISRTVVIGFTHWNVFSIAQGIAVLSAMIYIELNFRAFNLKSCELKIVLIA